MQIYNSLTKQKEEFAPRNGKKVKMFVCGPTVYDRIHIGNARTFVFFDVAAKYLRQGGYKVKYIQNITDIEDRIIARAEETGKNPLVLAKEFTKVFLADTKTLRITAVNKYAPASRHIKEVVSQVKKLIKAGCAYEIKNDGWYFDLSAFPEYGKLSGRTAEMADDAVSRIDENPNKRNRGDFCLWKFADGSAKEPSWKTELGKGRPGWHIEDTAITEKYFGPQYDLHGGGVDLMFPHHEAEIAQQESASGLKPFVKYWLHAGFLVNKNQKMSKSLSNFMTLNEALKTYPAAALRLYFLGAHYRSPLDLSEETLKSASAGTQRISEFVARLSAVKTRSVHLSESEKMLDSAKREFVFAMDDDFNTPQAIAVIFKLIKELNTPLNENRIDKKTAKKIKTLLDEFNSVLGIIPEKTKKIPDEILKMADTREKLRRDKRYSEADDLRRQITLKGYLVEDTELGSLIREKRT